MDLRKSSVQRDFEREIMGDAKPGYIDVDTGYHSERASFFSFFHQFPNIIFRYHGSVLPSIFMEICISAGLGYVAYHFKDTEGVLQELSPASHQYPGFLLCFLLVFRSQIAWNMYLSGYSSLTAIRTSLVLVANVVLAPMLAKCRNQ